MGNVGIITHCDPVVGTGHLTRCNILSKKLQKEGHNMISDLREFGKCDTIIIDMKNVKVINLDKLTKDRFNVIIGEEFEIYHNKYKTARNNPKNIIMFLGGFDQEGTTIKMIEIFKKLDVKIKKTILLSDNFLHFDKLNSLDEFQKYNIEIIIEAENIPELIYNSDLAISSGGNMMYEFACIGVPIICLPEDKFEDNLCDIFEKRGISKNLGINAIKSERSILGWIQVFLSDKDRCQKMIDQGKNYVDGKGLNRILKIINEK